MHRLLLLILVSLSLSACASKFRSTGARGAVSGSEKVHIKATSEDADADIRNAIALELSRRGLQVVDQAPGSGLTLKYYDDWKWDIVMYLWALDLQFIDSRTGRVLATGDFSHLGGHHYPNTRTVVRKIFERWDREGIFRGR